MYLLFLFALCFVLYFPICRRTPPLCPGVRIRNLSSVGKPLPSASPCALICSSARDNSIMAMHCGTCCLFYWDYIDLYSDMSLAYTLGQRWGHLSISLFRLASSWELSGEYRLCQGGDGKMFCWM